MEGRGMRCLGTAGADRIGTGRQVQASHGVAGDVCNGMVGQTGYVQAMARHGRLVASWLVEGRQVPAGIARHGLYGLG